MEITVQIPSEFEDAVENLCAEESLCPVDRKYFIERCFRQWIQDHCKDNVSDLEYHLSDMWHTDYIDKGWVHERRTDSAN